VQIRIREFQESDLEPVYEVVQESIAVSYPEVYPPEAVKLFLRDHSRERILEDARKGYCVVAENGEEIVGTGTLLESNHLRRFYINPACRFTGIGKKIYAEVEAKALEDRIDTLKLGASLLSKRFWESVGFELESEEAIPIENGQELLFYWMTKRLPVNESEG
jgi:GNAT superfamily N-acetyltransferase